MKLLAVETSSRLGSLCLIEFTPKKILEKSSSFVRENKSLGENKPKILSECVWDTRLGSPHSEVVTVQLIECFKRAQLRLQDVDLLSCSIGPGSFTGLRVGINLVSTLSYSFNNLPILAIHSLRVLAESAFEQKKGGEKMEKILCLLNAYRQAFYVGLFEIESKQKRKRELKEVLPPSLMSYEEILKLVKINSSNKNPLLCLGDGYSFLKKNVQDFSSSILERSLICDDFFSEFPLARFLGEVSIQGYSLNKFLGWRQLKPLYIRASYAEEKLEELKSIVKKM